jgi:hypothetical protein
MESRHTAEHTGPGFLRRNQVVPRIQSPRRNHWLLIGEEYIQL